MLFCRDGHVLAWGINDFGQLGNGSTDYEVTPTPVLGLDEVQVADIAAGGWHSLALTAAGGGSSFDEFTSLLMLPPYYILLSMYDFMPVAMHGNLRSSTLDQLL